MREREAALHSRQEDLVEEFGPIGAREMPIEELDFSVRTYNCLVKSNILTTTDLVRYMSEHADSENYGLTRISALGRKSFLEIMDTVKELGLPIPSRYRIA